MGKPVVIEEMFPLNCSFAEEFERFLDSPGTRRRAGSVSIGERHRSNTGSQDTIQDAIVLSWLELFEKKAKEFTSPGESNNGK